MPARIAGSEGSRSIPTAMALLAGLLAAFAFVAPAASADGTGVIVRYRPGTSAAERLDTRHPAGVTRQAGMLLPRAEVVDPGPGETAAGVIRALEANPDVAYAEPNGLRHAFATPSDPLFGEEWGLANTGQPIPNGDPLF